MREKDLNEGLGELAHAAEKDHEVQMARADLYKLAKYAIKLHDMLKKVPEEAGLEGWVASKITKAADYIGSVYHHLDYEDATGELGEEVTESKSCNCDENCPCGGNCGPNCDCHAGCSSMSEGKFKSDAHRKAIHAAKASGKKKMKKLRDHSDLSVRLGEKLAEKKAGIDAMKKAGNAKADAEAKDTKDMATAIKSKKKVAERSLSKGEEKKKEKYVKGMKKAKGDFKDRYGKDAEAVMYATATKMAKEAKKITPTTIKPSSIKSKKLTAKTE